MEYVGAIDQGTQSTRFTLYGSNGKRVAGHQAEFEQISSRAGWTEHDPFELLATVRTCIAEALKAAAAELGDIKIKAVGITNQRETTVVWDKHTGKPLHNAIVWLDNRTAALCNHMGKELGSKDYFRPTTGLPISTYFTAYKVAWLRENIAAVCQALASGSCRVGTIDTWLMHHLTGGPQGSGIFVTDVTNAACTNLMELATCTWHEPTLKLFGLERSMLADIRSSAEEYGRVAEGPLKGVPITGCLGDQQAALLGQRCRMHEAKNTYGTGCFLLLNTGDKMVESEHGLLTTIAWQLGAQASVQHALEGSVAIAGAGITWLRDRMGLIQSAADSEAVASSVPNTAGVYFVPAFSGLLAPHWRDDARGALLGVSSVTSRAHIVRAMLEAICWQTREVLDAMRSDADLSQLKLLRVDGGASNNALLMQLQADILQVDVHRPPDLETTSRGAAYAAGIGCGMWTEEWVMANEPEADGTPATFQPQVSQEDADRRYACWKIAVQHSFGLESLAPE